MWGGGAVSDEDRVTRDEARSLLSRTLRMAAPFKTTIYAALSCVVAVTLCTLAGPVLALMTTPAEPETWSESVT